MLAEIINQIRSKMQTKATKNHTMVDTRKLSPVKKAKMKKELTTPETKGKKPRTKTKRG
jgi:hypothetical protein